MRYTNGEELDKIFSIIELGKMGVKDKNIFSFIPSFEKIVFKNKDGEAVAYGYKMFVMFKNKKPKSFLYLEEDDDFYSCFKEWLENNLKGKKKWKIKSLYYVLLLSIRSIFQ